MELEYFLTYLMFYFVVVATSAILSSFLRGWTVGRMALAAIALTGIAIFIILGSILSPGQNMFLTTIGMLLKLQRSHCTAALLGISTAAPWMVLLFVSAGEEGKMRWVAPLLMSLSLLAALGAGSLVAGKPILTDYLANPDEEGKGGLGKARMNVPGFEVELVAQVDAKPVRIAVDEKDRVFFSAQHGIALQSGSIFRLNESQNSRQMNASKVAVMLTRPFGIAFRDGDMYVARSGQLTHAKDGKLEFVPAGAITRLRDLDGNGRMDYYEDVVKDLPGCQGPDDLHQNNGIAFAADGSLYITSGAAADIGPIREHWEGTILQASPDFDKVEIFARGLRNSFGIVVLPDGELLVTDNDVEAIDAGDELNHVVRGQHYGHPHVYGDDDGNGQFRKPIFLSRTPIEGLAYTNSDALPEKFRNCLYMVDFIKGRILRVKLTPSGDTFEVKKSDVNPFATIPKAVDLAITSDGVFYVTCYETGEIYRIRHVATK